ncbi:MAG: thioredoxin fold domain-containing protein, partial [Bacteroidia bacterium]
MGFGKRLFHILLIVIVFIFQSYCIDNEDDKEGKILFREETWRLLCKEATVKEKLIFVYVSADYCSACRRMEASFRSQKLGSLYNIRFVNIRFDAKDLIQHQRATSWGVTTVPTMVYLNEKRDVVHMVSGFRDAEGLLEEA